MNHLSEESLLGFVIARHVMLMVVVDGDYIDGE